MIAEIEQHLIDFVQSAAATEFAVDSETDLLTTNVLDSLLLMELVVVVENKWGVQLQGDDIAPDNFRCIRNLSVLIRDRQSKTATENVVA